MTRELRRVTLAVAAMFLTLFISATTIQSFNTEAIAQDPRNVRSLYESYKTKRGPILVDGKPIASSVEVNDAFRYLRVYEDPIYSSITGYFSLFHGVTGIEAATNTYLSGQSSSQFFEQVNAVLSGNPISGAAVELTIDPLLQQAAWDALGDYKGALVAIDPQTGNILAMVSKPGFDANRLAAHDNKKTSKAYSDLLANKANPLINKAISGDLYHPGSVFKLVMAAAALESGQYTINSKLENPVSIQLPGSTAEVYNSSRNACGPKKMVSLIYAMRYSCNVPFVEIGLALGQDRIRTQAELFGFGKEVNIPLIATPSIYPQNMDDAQLALSSFGQFDVRVSPLQMAMVSAAIANDGILMKPNLIESIISANLSVISQPEPEIFAQPITASTAEEITKMMIKSVSAGYASNASVFGYDIAGKTGTAENGVGERVTLWFTGFAPAVNPRVAIALVVEDGGGLDSGASGNRTAAPVARKFFQAVLSQ
ncbi:MAG: peptidoglycan D,D-transpeptidase FtsI family protein [Actinomycetota bacterium]